MKFRNILLGALVITSRFFKVSGLFITGTVLLTMSHLVYLYLVTIVVKLRHVLKNRQMPLGRLAICLIIVPLLSLIVHFSEETKDLYYNKGVWLSSLSFLFYFVFHIKQVDEKTIVKSMLIFASCLLAIQVVQQGFPYSAIFGTGTEDGESVSSMVRGLEMRNGLYRFRLGSYMITLFCMYYTWTRFLAQRNTKKFGLFACFLVSMYLFLTRQLMFASAIGLFSTFMFVRSNMSKKVMILLLSSVLLLVVYLNADLIFGDLIEKTRDESTDDNIRMLALEFYWEKIINNPIAFVVGNGYPSDMKMWNESLHLFTSDIGIVGQWFHYGVLWVALYLATLCSVLLRHRSSLPLYIKLFVFSTSINSIMIFPYYDSCSYILWAAILYICDLHITKSNRRMAAA